MRPDHVIIGSGINALVAGALLGFLGVYVVLRRTVFVSAAAGAVALPRHGGAFRQAAERIRR